MPRNLCREEAPEACARRGPRNLCRPKVLNQVPGGGPKCVPTEPLELAGQGCGGTGDGSALTASAKGAVKPSLRSTGSRPSSGPELRASALALELLAMNCSKIGVLGTAPVDLCCTNNCSIISVLGLLCCANNCSIISVLGLRSLRVVETGVSLSSVGRCPTGALPKPICRRAADVRQPPVQWRSPSRAGAREVRAVVSPVRGSSISGSLALARRTSELSTLEVKWVSWRMPTSPSCTGGGRGLPERTASLEALNLSRRACAGTNWRRSVGIFATVCESVRESGPFPPEVQWVELMESSKAVQRKHSSPSKCPVP